MTQRKQTGSTQRPKRFMQRAVPEKRSKQARTVDNKSLLPKKASRAGMNESWNLSLDMVDRLTNHDAIASGIDRPKVSFNPDRRIGLKPGAVFLRKKLDDIPQKSLPMSYNPNFA